MYAGEGGDQGEADKKVPKVETGAVAKSRQTPHQSLQLVIIVSARA